MKNRKAISMKLGRVISRAYCIIMMLLLLTIVISVFLIRGVVGACIWSFALLILSPISVILSLICMISIMIGIYKKQINESKIITLIVSLCLAYPIFILFGVSNTTYPTSKKTEPSISIEVPFKSDSKVLLLGGEEYKPHAIWASECYAYDVVKEPFNTNSKELNDYGIFGEEVIAPIAGTIIAAFDEEEDIAISTNEEDYLSSAGNYVYMKIEETGTYLMFIHLKQNSVTVQVGDYVQVGEVIGAVGNSGTASEPHLHLQHQRENPLNVIYTTCAEGLPIIFTDESKYTLLTSDQY